jgi:hypothetical protein
MNPVTHMASLVLIFCVFIVAVLLFARTGSDKYLVVLIPERLLYDSTKELIAMILIHPENMDLDNPVLVGLGHLSS